MGKEDRYAHLGDADTPASASEAGDATGADADTEDAERVTISDGMDELRLDLGETDLTVDDVKAALRHRERSRTRTHDHERTGEQLPPPWLVGLGLSRLWTRSLMTAGALGLRLGTRGLTAMERPTQRE